MASASTTAPPRAAPRARRATVPRERGAPPVCRRQAVPAFGAGCVHRPQLVERLVGSGDAWLVLASAPAGYGKTTLLSEWAAADRRPFAWLTLHERDDDPRRLTAAVADALAQGGASAAPLVAALNESAGTAPSARGRAPARNAAAGFVLVLDDAHAVSAGTLSEVVALVQRHLPVGAQVALASRLAAPFPVARMRASRTLIEIHPEDLAMTASEADRMMRSAGLELEPAAVERLVVRTEGWPAALYLATLSLRAQGGPAGAAERFSGDDRLMGEYLRDELLAALSDGDVEFAACASVLDEPTAAACGAVLQREDCATVLARLAEHRLLVAAHPTGEAWRWPGLVRDALAGELRRRHPRRCAPLQRRASAWHLAQGDVDRAIDHAVRARDVARAGDLLWAHGLARVAGGEAERVRGWLGALGDVRLSESPTASLIAAYSHLFGGDVALAQHWARQAAGAARRDEAAAPVPALAAGLALIEVATSRAGAARMGRDAWDVYEREPDDSPWRGVSCLLAGTADYLVGERASARVRLEEGARRSEVAAPLIAALCLAVTAMIAFELAHREHAAEASARALHLVQTHRLDHEPAAALVYAAAAAVQAHEGRVDEAKASTARATDLLVRLGEFLPWYGASARILLARAALGLTDVVRTGTLLAEASRMARRTTDATVFQGWLDDAWRRVDEHAESALGGPLGTSSLTTAELRILRFLPTHLSLREIADRLHVSANTVKTQAHAVYRKLDASSRSEAVARATAAGLLTGGGPGGRPS